MVGVDVQQFGRRGAGHVHDTHGKIRARVTCVLLRDAIHALAGRRSDDRIDGQPDVLLGDNPRSTVELGDHVAAAVLNRVHGAVVPKARAKKDAPALVTTREASC